ncbi:MAG TPA: hypothetical protein VM030_06525 [Acidimicrobiales bacterium]|nr:hypothetical protein [Acidimicrobiales bacterium]
MPPLQEQRWVNPHQPQTLQIAVFLMYFDAVFLVLLGGGFSAMGIVFLAAFVAAGWGIANERRWAYVLGVVIAALGLLPYVLAIGRGHSIFQFDLISLMFAIAKLALLLHPQSRDYQRIWFK